MKLHKILITLLSAITISSCTSGFEEMNKDPMAVNEISPSLSLPKCNIMVSTLSMAITREPLCYILSCIANI